jgi:NAD-dependent SIR2 family protein deacetylase
MRRWAAGKRFGAFVYTSNVDGQFQRAGFDADRVVEVHGSLDWLQCLRGCGVGLFAAGQAIPAGVEVEETTMRARPPLPACPACGGLARPNVLMFGDGGWDESRTDAQQDRLQVWLSVLGARDGEPGAARLVVVECGAGTAIPTVRNFSEWLAARGATLVRLNLREAGVPAGQIGLAVGALEGLRAIDRLLADGTAVAHRLS